MKGALPLEAIYQGALCVFDHIVRFAAMAVETVGVLVLLFSVGAAVISNLKRRPHVRLRLAKGISLSLEYKLGAELLRTAVVRSFEELFLLGAIILLRAALTVIIHWEIRMEQRRGEGCIECK